MGVPFPPPRESRSCASPAPRSTCRSCSTAGGTCPPRAALAAGLGRPPGSPGRPVESEAIETAKRLCGPAPRGLRDHQGAAPGAGAGSASARTRGAVGARVFGIWTSPETPGRDRGTTPQGPCAGAEGPASRLSRGGTSGICSAASGSRAAADRGFGLQRHRAFEIQVGGAVRDPLEVDECVGRQPRDPGGDRAGLLEQLAVGRDPPGEAQLLEPGRALLLPAAAPAP